MDMTFAVHFALKICHPVVLLRWRGVHVGLQPIRAAGYRISQHRPGPTSVSTWMNRPEALCCVLGRKWEKIKNLQDRNFFWCGTSWYEKVERQHFQQYLRTPFFLLLIPRDASPLKLPSSREMCFPVFFLPCQSVMIFWRIWRSISIIVFVDFICCLLYHCGGCPHRDSYARQLPKWDNCDKSCGRSLPFRCHHERCAEFHCPHWGHGPTQNDARFQL